MKCNPSHGLSSSPSSIRDIDTVDVKSEDIELPLQSSADVPTMLRYPRVFIGGSVVYRGRRDENR